MGVIDGCLVVFFVEIVSHGGIEKRAYEGVETGLVGVC